MQKINIAQIEKNLPLDFSKHCVRDISLLSCSVFGETHAVTMKEKFNVDFSMTFWAKSGNQINFYRSEQEYENFSKKLGNDYKANIDYAKELADTLIKMTDWFRSFIQENNKLEDSISKSEEFFNNYRDFFGYHQAVYWGGDYLTKTDPNNKQVKKIIKILDQAYKYNESIVPDLEKYFKDFEISDLFYWEIVRDLDNKENFKNQNRSILFSEKQHLVLSEEETNQLEKNIEAKATILIQNLEEFKGLAVNRGAFKGKVKKVVDLSKLGEVKQGDVLVTSMTRPQYNNAIKNAGAIVTDEGGMLCHASILAREFDIPCIVGTKIATKVLKDGDRVEVDADEGIIKILKN